MQQQQQQQHEEQETTSNNLPVSDQDHEMSQSKIEQKMEANESDKMMDSEQKCGEIKVQIEPCGKVQEKETNEQVEEAQLEDEDRISVCSSYEEFCGQQASELNLRRLKMDALEDLVVCGQNRASTESARRLFSCLSSSGSEHATGSGAERSAAGSLSSHSSGCHADESDELSEQQDEQDNQLLTTLSQQASQKGNQNNKNHDESVLNDIYSSELSAASERRGDDFGTIKLTRRKLCPSSCSDCSAGSSAGRPHCNYGSTLVCAVSPSRASSAGEVSPSSPSSPLGRPADLLANSALDGEEIRHCRAAFRENRRLIEQAQALAVKRLQQQQQQAQTGELAAGAAHLLAGSCALADRSHWSDSLSRRAQLPRCSHCSEKVYPLDRLELDFTRASLNIHRNCFKCQVCHTLLRLETYASIDTKLFCPAHTKLAAPLASSPDQEAHAKHEATHPLKMAKSILNWTVICVALAIVVCALSGAEAAFDAEMDSLADMFSSSLGTVSSKLGGPNVAGQPLGASEADTKMRELYSNLEKALMEARQVSANSRSALISSKIDTLRL